MKRVLIISFALYLCSFICGFDISAKKIKQSLKITKPKINTEKITNLHIIEVNFEDTTNLGEYGIDNIEGVRFSGYDKEINSNLESFLMSNPTDRTLASYTVKIDYLDMQGRMIHSREVSGECEIPPGETRRFDTKSWDTQHTYYYYLGNEPKRVATPYKVEFHPKKLSFF